MRIIIAEFLTVFFIVVFLVELLSYFGIRILIRYFSIRFQTIVLFSFIVFCSALFGLLIFSFSNPDALHISSNYSFLFFVILVSVLFLVPLTFFAVMTIISFPFRWFTSNRSQILILAGSLLLSGGIFLVIVHGIFFGKKNIQVERQNLYFEGLPKQLDGLKVVQISDIHFGTLGKKSALLESALDIITKEDPDILVFTGDLVNNFSQEIIGFESYLKQFPAKYGKFAILGNHDYGDYSQWPDSSSKKENLRLIRQGLTQAGFNLLQNSWAKISIKDTAICMIGVENWGHKLFPRYSRLDLALEGIPDNYFKILLSHNPTFWLEKVVPETDIPLTLSGHTHGGQFGIKIAGIEFSPIYFFQKEWAGLYQSDNQFIYVNRGLGCLGLPARIEMRPEITTLTLWKVKNH